ncbi:hypothetical protein Pelo_19662 [Pelomyxa schiedti]|nr:hypothetical protein Pelo_19662 [Pelomyxa schiedti]
MHGDAKRYCGSHLSSSRSHFRVSNLTFTCAHTLLSRGEETAGLQHTTVSHVAQYQQTPAHLLSGWQSSIPSPPAAFGQCTRCFVGHLTEKVL